VIRREWSKSAAARQKIVGYENSAIIGAKKVPKNDLSPSLLRKSHFANNVDCVVSNGQ